MGCAENKEHGGSGPLVLVPLMALFGAVVAIGTRVKHRKGHTCQCGHGHHGGHGPHDDHGPGPDHEDDPMRILDRRFASGEIDEDDYLRRREVLKPSS